jgi:hypothetical protein
MWQTLTEPMFGDRISLNFFERIGFKLQVQVGALERRPVSQLQQFGAGWQFAVGQVTPLRIVTTLELARSAVQGRSISKRSESLAYHFAPCIPPAHRQMSLNGSALIAVYRTVFVMLACLRSAGGGGYPYRDLLGHSLYCASTCERVLGRAVPQPLPPVR